MSELGQMLRDARQSRGISLAEAENATRIRRKYLEALEDANYGELPPSVYVRGFIRSYANYLGLDPEDTLAAYHDGAHTQPAEPRIISEPLTPSSPINWELIAGVVMLVALGAVLVLVYRQYVGPLALRSAGPPAAVNDVPGLATSSETPVPALGGNLTNTPTETATPTTPPTATPTRVAPTPTATQTLQPTPTHTPQVAGVQELTLRLQVTARSWTRVVVDGETVYEDILEPGEEQTWEAERLIELRTGNAGGLTAFINDRELGALGNSGQVLDYVWRLTDSGEVSMGTPTP